MLARFHARNATLRRMTDDAFDIVVVGGGAAGCVLAARLSDDPHCRVALVEAGERSRSLLLRVPGLGAFAPRVARHVWNHPAEPEPGLDGREPRLISGRGLGGGSSVNGMVCTRGHSSNYDAWAALGAEGWAFADVLPWFRRAETHARGASPWHGGDGPLQVRPSRPASELPARFLDAAAEAGFAVVDDLNADAVDAFGLTDVTIGPDGLRSSTRSAYLEPAARRPNLVVLAGRCALSVVTEAGRAIGVEVAEGGQRRLLRATREVVLAAGGLRTPQLLMLSGIGSADRLRALGLPVAADLPEVGRNLQNHPSFPMRFRGLAPLSLARHATPAGAIEAAFRYAATRGGVLAEGIFAAAGFVRTDGALQAPDAQIVMSPVLLPPDGAGMLGLLPRQHGMTLVVQQGTPFSRGSVTLHSANPLAPACIRTGAYGDPRDIAVMRSAIAIAEDIMARRPLAGLVREQPLGDAPTETQIRRLSGTAYHYCGTCRAGRDAQAVVDPALRVNGVGGLRVADASVMPLIPNAALHAPTVMVAERAAALIAASG